VANRWAARPVRDDGESSVVIRARRWLTALYMPFYLLGFVVGFLVFETFAPRSVASIFMAVHQGLEPLTAAWPLAICGLSMAFFGPLFGQLGCWLWLLVSKKVLGLTAQEVMAVDPFVDKDFLNRSLYTRLYVQREP
jgi:hypothetical protein